MEITTIDEQFGRSRQAVSLDLIEEWEHFIHSRHMGKPPLVMRKTIKIFIESNTLRDQCMARIDLWNDNEWEPLYSILSFAMQMPEALYRENSDPLKRYEIKKCRRLFEEDVLRLREVGKKILFGKDAK